MHSEDLPPLHPDLQKDLQSMAPLKTRRPGLVIGLTISGLAVWVGLGTLLLGWRNDFSLLPATRWILIAAIFLVGMLAPLLALLRPPSRSVMPSTTLLTRLGFIVISSAVAINVLQPWLLGIDPAGLGLSELWHTHGCLLVGAIAALIPIAVLARVERHHVPTQIVPATLAISAIGSMCATLILHNHCTIMNAWHLLLFHGGIFGLSWLIMRATARWLFRW